MAEDILTQFVKDSRDYCGKREKALAAVVG